MYAYVLEGNDAWFIIPRLHLPPRHLLYSRDQKDSESKPDMILYIDWHGRRGREREVRRRKNS